MDAQVSVTLTDLIQFLDGIALENLAEERGVTPREIVADLPKDTRRLVSANRFVEVMDAIATWGPVTVPLRTADGIVEFTGCLPRGEIKHGRFYWLGEGALRGHLRLDRCDGIAFVESAFMGRPSACVLFFNRDGAIMFKAFLARNGREPLPDQLTAFRALARRMSSRAPRTRSDELRSKATGENHD